MLPASVTLEKIREIAAANRPTMTLLSIVLGTSTTPVPFVAHAQ